MARPKTKVEPAPFKPTKQLYDRALGAIILDKEIKDNQEVLKEEKKWLADHGPLGQSIAIPGYGTVTFKNGTAAKPGGQRVTTYTFSAEKFKQLSPFMVKKLLDAGVVSVMETTTPATPEGEPSIAFKHNEE